MILRDWCDLPQDMQHPSIRSYYDVLHGKKYQLFIKFLLDRIIAGILLILLLPILFVLAICIKMDSPGEIFFRQKRITRYGKEFYIYKFRTMVQNAESVGAQVTSDNDARITKVGRKIQYLARRYDFCRDAPGSSKVCCAVYGRNACNTSHASRGYE